MSKVATFLRTLERLLGSSAVQSLCFGLFLSGVTRAAGLGFWTFFAGVVVYTHLAVKIDQIARAVAGKAEK